MKKNTFLLNAIIALCGWSAAMAQTVEYTDYQRYFSDMKVAPSGGIKTIPDLQRSAALKADEAPYDIKILPGKRKVLSGKDIYASRKNSVFIVGKLKKAKRNGADVSFDITGTAFAIDQSGVCVTNYHVLKGIIGNDPEAREDSALFIISHDKQVYFIDSILAYSQNNDLAVFKVNTSGRKLDPVPLGKPAEVGATVYCISHPGGFFYYFTRGMVARNVTISGQQAIAGYNPKGRPPIRMQITADYGVGSSGGPILDECGNLVGIVSSTTPVGIVTGHQQMVVKETSPVGALRELLGDLR